MKQELKNLKIMFELSCAVTAQHLQQLNLEIQKSCEQKKTDAKKIRIYF